VPATRSATMPFTGWKKSWTVWKWRVEGAAEGRDGPWRRLPNLVVGSPPRPNLTRSEWEDVWRSPKIPPLIAATS
jgi:hypothetical protein